MISRLNSFTFYLVVIIVTGALTVIGLAFVYQQTIQLLDRSALQLSITERQNTNVYRMAILIERAENLVLAGEDPASVLAQLDSLISVFQATQDVLRLGSDTSELSLAPLDRPELLALLDLVDTQWAVYKTRLQDFIVQPDPDIADQVNQSALTTSVYFSRLSRAISIDLEQQKANAFQLFNVAVAIALLLLPIGFFVVWGMSRTLQNLRNTAEEFTKGNLKARANTQTLTEFSQIANVFNDMAAQTEKLLIDLRTEVVVAEEARERAEQSDQVKSAFLASMSHELRTPLNAVINFTHFVIDGDTGPVNEQQHELLTEAVGSAKYLLNLINDVLDMSKIESGSLNLFIQDDVSMDALLKSALTTGQGLLKDKPIQLHTDIADNLPLVRADKQRILQILLNIISNACKFTDEGEIIVRAHGTDNEIVISVQDTGPGIAPEDQSLVFDAFQQTSSGLRQAGGTGLGMPIARSLAEAHGGRLWLESEYGTGATFYFSMPVRSDELIPTLA